MLAGCAQPHVEAPPPATTTIACTAVAVGNEGKGLLCRPEGKIDLPAIIVLHGDHGLRTFEKKQAERLAALGYAVLAIDLYRGQTADNFEDAHILERGLPENQALADIKSAVDYLRGQPFIRKEAIGILGFDMGGGLALAACCHDERLAACAVCYGKLITDPARLGKLRAAVLGIFAGKDEGIPPETVAAFRAALDKAGKPVPQLHTFAVCSHGFLDPAEMDAPFDEARGDAWGKIESFFAAELGKGPS